MKFTSTKLLFVFTLLFSLFFIDESFSQTPGVQWSRPLGGTRTEYGRDVQKTADGGFLFYGYTSSNDKDVSGNHSDSTDMWVVKMDKLGKIQWQRCYGGIGTEYSGKLICNPDGTAVLFGSASNNNGDVSGNHGRQDLWLIKIDASGNILWTKSLGGSGDEGGTTDIKRTNDNGYIILSHTKSNDGDVTGNHGAQDVWVVKLSSDGNIEWQKALGGTSDDWGNAIVQHPDGNYVLTGYPQSNDGDIPMNRVAWDLWVVKLSSSGAILWSKTYGGSFTESGYNVIIANDGSVVAMGHTSSIDGDITGRTRAGDRDIWILNINYNSGNLIWERSIGGSKTEGPPYNIFQDAEGKFLVSCITHSRDEYATSNHGSTDVFLARLESDGTIEWTKCFGGSSRETLNSIFNDMDSKAYVFVADAGRGDGDIIGYHQNTNLADSSSDAWLVKVNYDGSIAWQRCLGGTSVDNLFTIGKISETSYILAGNTGSDDGDVRLRRGFTDAWVVLVGPVNTIKGTLFIDNNLNGIKDVNEPYYSDAIVHSKKNSDSISTVPFNGLFVNDVDTGNYVTNVTINKPYYTLLSGSVSSNFSSYFNIDSISFALQPVPNKKDLSINLLPLTTARPGFGASYLIRYTNAGTTTISSGEIVLKKDARTNFLSASPAISSSNGDTLKWSYTNLNPGDTASILLNFQVSPPPAVVINDTLIFQAIITPSTGDETPFDDTAIVKQIVRGSYDPNDKAESNAGVISPQYVSSGKYLNYLVRFQNTGTDTAFNVIIRDTLDSKLDCNTFEIVDASHSFNVQINDGNKVAFNFPDINLPDSNINEPASHGFIAYRIKPLLSVVTGDIITNTASIYFDYNLPVVTNTVATQVVSSFSTLPLQLISFTGNYKEPEAHLQWSTQGEYNVSRFEIERSLDGTHFQKTGEKQAITVGNSNTYEYNENIAGITRSVLYYRLKMIDIDGRFTYSTIVPIRVAPGKAEVVVYPNPIANGAIRLMINASQKEDVEIRIVDNTGKIIRRQRDVLYIGDNAISIREGVSVSGVYYLQVVGTKINTVIRLVIP